MNGASLIASRIASLGVRHVFGVGGANVEDIFAALQELNADAATDRGARPMTIVLSKHEFGAATAADGYARVSGRVGVVLATSGGGAMNLVAALAEARASRVPLLAIVGEPPRPLQGRGAFQDIGGRGGAIDARAVFAPVSAWCERVETIEALPGMIDAAIAAAHGPIAGPAVLLVAKDLQRCEVPPHELARECDAPGRGPASAPATLRQAASALRSGPVVVVAGDGVPRSGARTLLARLATALDDEVAVTPDARDAFDNASPRFAGVVGTLGHVRAARALAAARTCLVVGTRLPVFATQGLEEALACLTLVTVGAEPCFAAAAATVRLDGELVPMLRALLAELGERRGEASDSAQPAEALPAPLPFAATPAPLDSRGLLDALEGRLPEDAVVLVDAGNTGASAAHFLPAPRRGHWLMATGMAGMGYTFGAAVGAAAATGRRCFVLAGDGAFFMHGFEIHTALEHALPITYVLFNNNAHGMCVTRERLGLGGAGVDNRFSVSRLGAGLAAMFPGLASEDCRGLEELGGALDRAARASGPSVVCAELSAEEIPPFFPFQQALAATLPTLNPGESNEPHGHRQAV